MRRKSALGSAANPRSATRVSTISYRFGSGAGRGSSFFRLRLIFESLSPTEFLVGDPLVRLRQSGPRRLDVEAILRLFEQPLEQLQVRDGNDGRGILAPAVNDD